MWNQLSKHPDLPLSSDVPFGHWNHHRFQIGFLDSCLLSYCIPKLSHSCERFLASFTFPSSSATTTLVQILLTLTRAPAQHLSDSLLQVCPFKVMLPYRQSHPVKLRSAHRTHHCQVLQFPDSTRWKSSTLPAPGPWKSTPPPSVASPPSIAPPPSQPYQTLSQSLDYLCLVLPPYCAQRTPSFCSILQKSAPSV